jgi:hypothetical protein
MSPRSIGELKKQVAMTDTESNETDDDEDEDGGASTRFADTDELLYQSFMLNPTLHVHEYLRAHNTQCMAFLRYECGEVLPAATNDSDSGR